MCSEGRLTTPLLIISDAPTSHTGLGRICRELATKIHEDLSDVFEVATFTFGGTTSRHLPFLQYPMTQSHNYVPPELPKVWKDFAGEKKGVVLTIWNPSWLRWLVDPDSLPDSQLKNFLKAGYFKTWGYFPIDGHGPDGMLPKSIVDVIDSFDRKLAYTKWAAKIIGDSIAETVPALPHGLDTNVFKPYDKMESRKNFFGRLQIESAGELKPDLFFVGVVATNTQRKDWYLAFQTCQELLKRGVNVGLWAHTDAYIKAWDLLTLKDQFGMHGRVTISTAMLDDVALARCYSCMDVTLGIGSGEGWGFPLAESLACGVPVIHGGYGGGAEFCPFIVPPVAWRGEGVLGIKRPVYSPQAWADAVMVAAKHFPRVGLPPYISWDNAWPEWKKWLTSSL
jgi:glycosyltransferase involved in cell wall biosynthesis